MRNPLDGFKSEMIDFQIYRNENLISVSKGLRNTEKGTHRKFVGFYPDTDIQVGDILIMENTNMKSFIVDIDIASYKGSPFQIKAYYQTTPPVEQNSNSTIYNIGTASNSIIGNQQQAILNNSSFNIDDLKQLIELYGANDKERLNQLSALLEDSLKKDNIKKSAFSKFSDLLAKHSWLPTAIAQVICTFIQK